MRKVIDVLLECAGVLLSFVAIIAMLAFIIAFVPAVGLVTWKIITLLWGLLFL